VSGGRLLAMGTATDGVSAMWVTLNSSTTLSYFLRSNLSITTWASIKATDFTQ
jgi:hypothetical protein